MTQEQQSLDWRGLAETFESYLGRPFAVGRSVIVSARRARGAETVHVMRSLNVTLCGAALRLTTTETYRTGVRPPTCARCIAGMRAVMEGRRK